MEICFLGIIISLVLEPKGPTQGSLLNIFIPARWLRERNHRVLNSWPQQVWNPGFTPPPPRTKPVYKVFVNTVFVIPWAFFFSFKFTKEFSKANFAWRNKTRGCKSVCQPAPKQKCLSGERACLLPSVSTVYNLAHGTNTAVWTFLGKPWESHTSQQWEQAASDTAAWALQHLPGSASTRQT